MTQKIKKILFCFLFLVIFSFVAVDHHGVSLADTGQNEKEIMALYLYNFLLFVEWPEGDCGLKNTINVTIYGDPLLFKAFAPMAGKILRGKKLHVTTLDTLKDPDRPCQVIFISASKQSDVPDILKMTNRCTLTLSDMEGFTQKGGMVYFENPARESNRKGKRFEINLSAVERSCLKIRSRLLRISHIVYDVDPLTPGPMQPTTDKGK